MFIVLIQVEHHTSATACESSACDTDNYGRGVGQYKERINCCKCVIYYCITAPLYKINWRGCQNLYPMTFRQIE